MKRSLLFFTLFTSLYFIHPLTAQYKILNPEPVSASTIVREGYGSFGLGIGLPYGGLGTRFGYNMIDKVNLFMGLGYNFHQMGFNLGVAYDFAQVNRTSFYVEGMAGYNSVILVIGKEEYNETFYGPSIGLGMKFNSRKSDGNYWQLGLIMPFVSSAYDDVVDKIKNDPDIAEFTEASPVLISVGYNLGF